MKKIKIIIIALGIQCLTGCSTMYFHNNVDAEEYAQTKWHHGGVYDLIEFSKPINMEKQCIKKEWAIIKTEKNVYNVLTETAESIWWIINPNPIMLVGLNFYDPWSVSINCEKIENL